MEKNWKKVVIHTDYITLGQFLKFEDIIREGGEAKEFILSHSIKINGEDNKQRGKKLYPKTTIEIDKKMFFEITK